MRLRFGTCAAAVLRLAGLVLLEAAGPTDETKELESPEILAAERRPGRTPAT